MPERVYQGKDDSTWNNLHMKYISLLLVATLAGCGGDDDKRRGDLDTGTSVTDGLNFRATTGKGVIEEPDNTFAIPACGDDRKLGYITTSWSTPIPAGATFTVAFNVWLSEGAKIVGYEDYSIPTRAALYIQRRNGTKTAKKDPYALASKLYYQGYREWSHAREALTAGDHVFSVRLTPEQWVFPDQLGAALGDPANVGITFSGTGSAGHGVCMTAGSGYVTIYSLTFN